jgi:hypothetical protein
MLGRGIDMLQPTHCSPEIYESYCTSAWHYVTLAEARNGPLPPLHGGKGGEGGEGGEGGAAGADLPPSSPSYVWGDALAVLQREQPDVRIVNLETAVTTSPTPWPVRRPPLPPLSSLSLPPQCDPTPSLPLSLSPSLPHYALFSVILLL